MIHSKHSTQLANDQDTVQQMAVPTARTIVKLAS